MMEFKVERTIVCFLQRLSNTFDSRIYTGYDETTNSIIRDAKPVDHEDQADAWLIHADTLLPRKSF